MVPLIVGTVLALGALVYVLWPLIAAAEGRAALPRRAGPPFPDMGDDRGGAEGDTDDPVEAEIRRARAQIRVCAVCGPRPEPSARYCSRCGRALA